MTDETKFKLLAAFRHMGMRINMEDFEARLIFQKQTYLLQELGLQLGNAYGWYIRGPYSRDAANDGFQLVSIQDQITEVAQLSNTEINAINNFRRLVTEAEAALKDKDKAYVLELLGSLHFLLRYGYPRPVNEKDALVRFLSLKPRFKDEAELVLKLLLEYGLASFS